MKSQQATRVLCSALLAISCTRLCAAEDLLGKEGLWRTHIKSTLPGNQVVENTTSVCQSFAFAEAARKAAETEKSCHTIRQSTAGSQTTSETECNLGGIISRTKGVSTRKGDTAVHLETHISVSIRGKQSETFVVTDSQWMGACPAGMQPGDMIDKDGKLSRMLKK